MASLQVQFEEAAAAAPKLKQASNEDKLEFYGLYKQGKGETYDSNKSFSVWEFEAKAKHAAWGKVSDLSPEEAQRKYSEHFEKMKEKYGLKD